MTLLLVLLLAGLWGAVFMPSLLRARRGTSPIVSVGTFSRGMRALAGGTGASGGRWILTPRTEPSSGTRSSVEFRRKVFTYLLATAALTLTLGLLPGLQVWLWIHLAVDASLAGFIAFLIKSKPQPPRAEVIEFKREEAPVPEPMVGEEVDPAPPTRQLTLDDDEYLKVGFGV